MDIRVLQADDLAAYRAIRARALTEHPEAFATSLAKFEAEGDMVLRQRLIGGQPENVTFGAFEGDNLLGTLIVYRDHQEKLRHRGHIAGMYVAPERRGAGVGRALLETAMGHLSGLDGLQQIVLAVTAGNVAARRLYRSAGFITWGVDPGLIRVGDVYHDVEWMALMLETRVDEQWV